MKSKSPFMRTILKGFMVVLPLAVIGATIYWVMHTLESGSGWLLQLILPARLYFPGMGVVVGILLIYLVGLLMSTQTAQNLSSHWENLLEHIPLVKSLYGAVQDMVQFFSSNTKQRFNKVVSVTLKDSDIRLIGFVTQENLIALPQVTGASDMVVIYLPMSYQIGGYMVLVPRSAVEPINMSIEDASRLVFTAGMSINKNDLSEGRKNGLQHESIINEVRREL